MSELSPDEPSIATAGAARTAELARGGTDPVAERRRAFDRERKRRASAKASLAESQHAPPPPKLHEKSSVVAKPFATNRGTRIPNNWIPDEKWLLQCRGRSASTPLYDPENSCRGLSLECPGGPAMINESVLRQQRFTNRRRNTHSQ
jgi:hypothetical protein